MKHFNNHLSLVLILLCGLLLAACESNVGEDPDPPDENNPPIENPTLPNAISGNLIFNDATLITGVLPASTGLTDLKVDKSVINLWPGIKNRIRIKNDGTHSISAILIQIAGAGNYHEVKPEPDESNDTLTVFYIDIDPEDLELPLDSKIIIAPIDPGGAVIDTTEKGIHIDTPFEADEPSGSGTCGPALDVNLHWIYTTLNGQLELAPGSPRISNYEVKGCCFNGVSSPCGFSSPNASVTVDNQWDVIDEEVIKFLNDGSEEFLYVLDRSFNDYDPKTTDFCAGTAGYSSRSSGIGTNGLYTMSPANGFETFYEVTIDSINFSLDDALKIGYGPFTDVNFQNPNFEYYLGCKFYVERRNIEGSVFLRVFEIKPEGEPEWYD